jgi:hypothetical protein
MSATAVSPLACFVATLALSWSDFAGAHHSAAVFDPDQVLELRGVIVNFNLRSPHATFVIDARTLLDDRPVGDVERWEIESESVPVLSSLGIDAGTFEAGDTVTMKVAPHRDPAFKFAHSFSIVDAFGSEYVMANSARLYNPSLRAAAGIEAGEDVVYTPRATGAARLEGRWQQPLAIIGDGPGLPLNEGGIAAWRNYDRVQSPANTCEPVNVPDLFLSAFFLFELRIDEQRAVLHHEYYDVVRTVPLDAPPAAADAGGRFGLATARIEGEALVVESREFRASRWGLGVEEAHRADIPSSAHKTLAERFAVTPDGRTLIYTYTLADPTYMTSPYEGRVELTRVPDDSPFYPFDCDVESASMWSRGAPTSAANE